MSAESVGLPGVSVVIRCFNERRHIGNLLDALRRQTHTPHEVIVVDSGSTDGTLDIVRAHPCRLLQIDPADFTFGRSLNVGCAAATGDVLVIASAHVLPRREDWLARLVAPFAAPDVALVYGRQTGNDLTRFSEHQVFQKHFPPRSDDDQVGPFCNNANAAIRRALWEQHPYDESLTGLEDLAWGKWALSQGHRLVYSAEAEIIHIHDERAPEVYRRYRREAIALRRVVPDSHLSLWEMVRFLTHSVALDLKAAWRTGRLHRVLPQVLVYRAMQYLGTYSGLHYRSPVTHELIMRFYYPAAYASRAERKGSEENSQRGLHSPQPGGRAVADEGPQRAGARQELPAVRG